MEDCKFCGISNGYHTMGCTNPEILRQKNITMSDLKRINAELRKVLKDVIDEGCSCDLLSGYQCGIHKYEKYIYEVIK